MLAFFWLTLNIVGIAVAVGTDWKRAWRGYSVLWINVFALWTSIVNILLKSNVVLV